MGSRRLGTILLIAAASVVLGVASTVLVIASPLSPRLPSVPASCNAPTLPGAIVDVTITDMGGMMGPGMMAPGMMAPGMMGPGMMGQGMGMMRIVDSPSTVAAGQVTLRVHNTGSLPHELVVLPLGLDQHLGQRAIGADGKVDEAASLGEAARTCDADEGDGIAAGTMGWTTLNLAPGRYELLCNIAGHYGAGMYAELDVVGNR